MEMPNGTAVTTVSQTWRGKRARDSVTLDREETNYTDIKKGVILATIKTTTHVDATAQGWEASIVETRGDKGRVGDDDARRLKEDDGVKEGVGPLVAGVRTGEIQISPDGKTWTGRNETKSGYFRGAVLRSGNSTATHVATTQQGKSADSKENEDDSQGSAEKTTGPVHRTPHVRSHPNPSRAAQPTGKPQNGEDPVLDSEPQAAEIAERPKKGQDADAAVQKPKAADTAPPKTATLTGIWKNAGGVQVKITDDGKSLNLQVGETPSLVSLSGSLSRTEKGDIFEGTVRIIPKADRNRTPLNIPVKATLLNKDELHLVYAHWPTFNRKGIRQIEDTKAEDSIKRISSE